MLILRCPEPEMFTFSDSLNTSINRFDFFAQATHKLTLTSPYWSSSLQLLRELVAEPTITPDDHQAQNLLANYLGNNFIRLDASGTDSFNRKVTNSLFVYCNDPQRQAQLQARVEAGATHLKDFTTNFLPQQTFCFAGHTDVVPLGETQLWDFPAFDPVIYRHTISGQGQDADPSIAGALAQHLEQLDNLQKAEPTPPQFAATSPFYVHGRGTTDMKAGMAAATVAAHNFVTAYRAQAHNLQVVDKDFAICLLVTSDEEGEALAGTKLVVQELQRLKATLEWCIVAEPSSSQFLGDTIRVGRRGSASYYLTINGCQGHVAATPGSDNPIHIAAQLIQRLSSLELDHGNAHFPPSSLQIVDLHSGDGTNNLVPQRCQLVFNVRFNNEWTYQRLTTYLEELFAECLPAHSYSLTHNCSGESFLSDPHSDLITNLKAAICWSQGVALQQANSQVTQDMSQASLALLAQTNQPAYMQLLDLVKCDTGGGTSDARFITKICRNTIEFGTTNKTLHQVNENVNVAEYLQLINIYQRVLELCFQVKQA